VVQNGIWVWKNVLSKCMHNIKVMRRQVVQNGIWLWKNVLSKCMHNIKVMKIGAPK
jgi:hypothetical protein